MKAARAEDPTAEYWETTHSETEPGATGPSSVTLRGQGTNLTGTVPLSNLEALAGDLVQKALEAQVHRRPATSCSSDNGE